MASAKSESCQTSQLQLSHVPVRSFRNTGVSCYVNTRLQLLATDVTFVEMVQKHTCDASCVACSLRHDLCTGASIRAPFVPRIHLRSKDLEMAGFPTWSAPQQQDVSEFVQAIARGLDTCEHAGTTRGDFYRCFGNRLEDRIDCTHCGFVRDWQVEKTDTVLLRLKAWFPGCDISEAIKREYETENLDAQYRCDRCGQRGSSTRSWRFARLAPCLLISIDRTQFRAGMQVPKKRVGRVKLPDMLPLETSHARVRYGLVAAACHIGASANAGHWVTWRRGPGLSTIR